MRHPNRKTNCWAGWVADIRTEFEFEGRRRKGKESPLNYTPSCRCDTLRPSESLSNGLWRPCSISVVVGPDTEVKGLGVLGFFDGFSDVRIGEV